MVITWGGAYGLYAIEVNRMGLPIESSGFDQTPPNHCLFNIQLLHNQDPVTWSPQALQFSHLKHQLRQAFLYFLMELNLHARNLRMCRL